MTDFNPSERVKLIREAFREETDVDQGYIMDMDITEEEKVWIIQKESKLDFGDGDLDELDVQGTIRTWGTKLLDEVISPIEDHQYIVLA